MLRPSPRVGLGGQSVKHARYACCKGRGSKHTLKTGSMHAVRDEAENRCGCCSDPTLTNNRSSKCS